METFSVQYVDIDHAIKEVLVLFTKHLCCWAGWQPVVTTEDVSPTGLHIAFLKIIVSLISQVCKYLLNILPYFKFKNSVVSLNWFLNVKQKKQI
jgi:hypothetical protein